MARRLKTLAREINETLPGHTAEVRSERLDTDVKHGRIRYPRKGIAGNSLRVYYKHHCVLSYHTGEPYRTNADVEKWIEERRGELERGEV